jgi:hypothetical protein
VILFGVAEIVGGTYVVAKDLDNYWHPIIKYSDKSSTTTAPAPAPAPAPAAAGGKKPPNQCQYGTDYLHRPYVQKGVKDEVTTRQRKKDPKGRLRDPNTGKVIKVPNLGHVPGHEFWREKRRAEEDCWSQGLFNIYMNNADFYEWEEASENQSHAHEDKSPY